MRFYNKYIQILCILIGTFLVVLLVNYICSVLSKRVVPYNEGLTNIDTPDESRCPNMLIERENNYFLYNSKMAIVPGVNPIQFKSLEEYSEFLDWQRGQGINCPVLELKYSTDPQGNDVYKIKPDMFKNQGGLPNTSSTANSNGEIGMYQNDTSSILDANMDSTSKKPIEFNKGTIGFDPQNQYIGLQTPIDNITSNKSPSANPMDSNWGGAAYTQNYVSKR